MLACWLLAAGSTLGWRATRLSSPRPAPAPAPLGTTIKTLFAVGLVGAAALFAYGLGLDPSPPSASRSPAAVAPDAELETSSTSGPQAAPHREAVSTAAGGEAWLEHPYRFELEVLVVDRLGLPVEGQSLRLSLPASTMIDAPGASGPDGRLTMSWPSRLPTGSAVLVDERDTRRSVAMQHGTKTRVTLLGVRGGKGPELVLSFVQDGAQRGQMAVTNKVSFVRDFATPKSDDDSAASRGLHPYVVFDTAAAVAKVEVPAPVDGITFVSEITFDSNSFVLSAAFGEALARATQPPALATTTASTARIAGTVFGEDGKPAAKLPVVVLGPGPQPLQQVETDDAGQFLFENLAAADFTVRAGGTEAGLAAVPATTTTGTTTVQLNLRRGSCVRGKALRADGAPIRDAVVTWRAIDGTWCDETTSHQDGSFTFANLPGTAGTVLLWAPNDEHPLPIASAANVLCDTGELVLRAERTAESAVRIEPVLPEGVEGSLSVRVWNLDLGIATRIPDPEAGRAHALGKLGAGWYRVEVHHATTGWFDAGRHWLDGKTDCDLGRVVLPQPAKVKFELDPSLLPVKDQQAFEVCSLRRDVDVRLAGVGPADTLLLPAGDYVFAWRGLGGAAHFHRFAAVAGRELTVRPER